MFKIDNLEELLQRLIESGKNTIETDKEIISYNIDGNSFSFSYKTKQPKKSDLFDEWVKTLDDDLFLETCELYQQKYGKMSDLVKQIDEENEEAMQNFKDVFFGLVNEKIEKLNSYLQ